MICKNCHKAFNGSTGICHLCGTVHSETVKPEHVQQQEIETVIEPEVEAQTSMKKKKTATKK